MTLTRHVTHVTRALHDLRGAHDVTCAALTRV